MKNLHDLTRLTKIYDFFGPIKDWGWYGRVYGAFIVWVIPICAVYPLVESLTVSGLKGVYWMISNGYHPSEVTVTLEKGPGRPNLPATIARAFLITAALSTTVPSLQEEEKKKE